MAVNKLLKISFTSFYIYFSEKKKERNILSRYFFKKQKKKTMEVLSISPCTGSILYSQQVQTFDTIVNSHSTS